MGARTGQDRALAARRPAAPVLRRAQQGLQVLLRVAAGVRGSAQVFPPLPAPLTSLSTDSWSASSSPGARSSLSSSSAFSLLRCSTACCRRSSRYRFSSRLRIRLSYRLTQREKAGENGGTRSGMEEG